MDHRSPRRYHQLPAWFPQFSISIALKHKGVLEQALVYDPDAGGDVHREPRRRAQLNDRRIRVTSRKGLEGALLGTGFPLPRAGTSGCLSWGCSNHLSSRRLPGSGVQARRRSIWPMSPLVAWMDSGNLDLPNGISLPGAAG